MLFEIGRSKNNVEEYKIVFSFRKWGIVFEVSINANE